MLITFFEWCSHPNEIDKYRHNLRENIFAVMEMGKQPYSSIVTMPIAAFQHYIKWKSELEEEKSKIMKEKTGNIKRK